MGEESHSKKDPIEQLDPVQPSVCAIAKTDLEYRIECRIEPTSAN
jgi:hypothetical protein